jgi:cellulose biosynthesis protein BcsQ
MPQQATANQAKANIVDSNGHPVPVVAFYSVQGGVGKSTLAKKFAELVTIAPGQSGQRPNVLLIDLDVDSRGLTSRLSEAMRQSFGNFRTAHDVFAERNVAAAQAISVTPAVSLAGGNPQHRGQLYLMPAAQHGSTRLFDVMAHISSDELYNLLLDMVQSLVTQYGISCVVIDCAPGNVPYSAAAATLADFPLFIGRNDIPSYEGIRRLPEQFREMYRSFQPQSQRVIINAVSVRKLYEERAKEHVVFDYIPLTTDVILETEGLPRTGSLQMLLFEKYVVDIIKQVLIGKNHLIPEAPEVLGREWIDVLQKLERAEEAPSIRRLKLLGFLLWPGGALVVLGLSVMAYSHVVQDVREVFTRAALIASATGVIAAAIAWYGGMARQRLLATAQKLVFSGPDEIFRRLNEGPSHRKELESMRQLADTISDRKAA